MLESPAKGRTVMHRSHVVSLCVAIAIGCLPIADTATAQGDPAARLAQRVHAFLEGASRNDRRVHDSFWAEDVVYTSSAGQRFGKQRIMDELADAPAVDESALPRYRGENVSVRIDGDVGVVTFRLVAEQPDGARARYYNTGVFRLDHGQWRAFAWQATRIPAGTVE
jgi:hypothetical protein